MPPKHETLLEQMRNSSKGWKVHDLYSLYEGFGFIIMSGSRHDLVKHPDFPTLRTAIPRHNKLAVVYIKNAVKLIDRYKSLSEEKDN